MAVKDRDRDRFSTATRLKVLGEQTAARSHRLDNVLLGQPVSVEVELIGLVDELHCPRAVRERPII